MVRASYLTEFHLLKGHREFQNVKKSRYWFKRSSHVNLWDCKYVNFPIDKAYYVVIP